ncbi:sigma-70 family RNA polymerase sigma factor [Furfurilactobacillus milii]|uniref:Sigma-70 family RNA polymerase sigma factor n=1 Tax=Furfurilactobacillus milii TaxID=2888272 RepID=A0A6N9I0U5_9LACO|nr:sigma-70 family RNA polymerase sigma factor [Furfurilactobacillus milii]MYV16046.1 hypothetical protein [Furfurilactobacillus milii]
MSKEREVNKRFVKYIERSIINHAIHHWKRSNQVIQVELNERIANQLVSKEKIKDLEMLTENNIAHMEDYIANDRLAWCISTITKEEKQLMYDKYVTKRSDAEIALGLGLSRQAVAKRRHQTLAKILNMYQEETK